MKKCIQKTGFTIIEILVIIAVIAILVGLLVSGGTAARRKAKIYRTKAMIASLETALAMYHVDFGAYPDPSTEKNKNLINLLAAVSVFGTNADWQGPYISFKDEDLKGSIPNATLRDPWGTDYTYSYNSSDSSCTITSAGPDMSLATGDDITNQ